MLREWGCDYIQGRLIGLARADRPWTGDAPAMPKVGWSPNHAGNL